MAKKLAKTVVKKTVKAIKPKPVSKSVSPERVVPTEAPRVDRVVGAPHGIVQARAGTGKTFTLILGVANIYRDEKMEGSYTFRGPKGGQLSQATTPTLWGKVEREVGRWRNPLTGHWEYPAEIKRVVPSPQQKAVWDFMAKERPKTVCYVAFNNSIVDDFSEKYDWLVEALSRINVKLTFSTLHSLGHSACREYYRPKNVFKAVNKYKTSDLLSALWEVDLREVWKEKAEQIQAIQQLVGLCKQTLTDDASEEDLEAMAIHYGIDLTEKDKVFDATRKLLKMMKDNPRDGTARWDFNDMSWLPVVNNLPVQKFDLLLVDESQDLDRCQQELILKAGKRIILVGDDRQAIYGFRGADTDSMSRMATLLGDGVYKGAVTHLHLTQTRRCGKAIVELAKQLVPDFEAHKDNKPGKVSRVHFDVLEDDGKLVCKSCGVEKGHSFGTGDCGCEVGFTTQSSDYSLGEADMVLCRVNAPLVGLAFRMLKAGKRVNIKGRDIGEGLKGFIKKSKCQDVSAFLIWLDQYQQQTAERIQRRRNVDNEALVELEDRCTCLRTFADGAVTVKDMYKAIDEVFKGKVCPQCNKSFGEEQKNCWDCKYLGKPVALVKPAGTLLSSIHRAKGMEAKRVFILRPDLMPHPKAKSEWEMGQERNLQYVAQTRAIEELVFVDGKFKGGEA